jgi:hypothetical protein
MPLHFAVKPEHEPNRCIECGEVCRRPKRFCSDSHKEIWASGRHGSINPIGAEQVAVSRRLLGITAESLEWRRKLNVQRAF